MIQNIFMLLTFYRNMELEEELKYIRDYVNYYREKTGVTKLGFEPLWELSCFSVGEGYNLLYRQLIQTHEGYGGWIELKDSDIRKIVLDEIRKDKAWNKDHLPYEDHTCINIQH